MNTWQLSSCPPPPLPPHVSLRCCWLCALYCPSVPHLWFLLPPPSHRSGWTPPSPGRPDVGVARPPAHSLLAAFDNDGRRRGRFPSRPDVAVGRRCLVCSRLCLDSRLIVIIMMIIMNNKQIFICYESCFVFWPLAFFFNRCFTCLAQAVANEQLAC